MNKEMAIINEVGIGIRDLEEPVLWFTVTLMSGVCALQVFDWQQAAEIIKAYSLYEVHSLKGKPCRVEKGDGKIKYIGPVLVKN